LCEGNRISTEHYKDLIPGSDGTIGRPLPGGAAKSHGRLNGTRFPRMGSKPALTIQNEGTSRLDKYPVDIFLLCRKTSTTIHSTKATTKAGAVLDVDERSPPSHARILSWQNDGQVSYFVTLEFILCHITSI
jgi:hypothetical protein